jgi:metal-dependent HD superfamily phosphatase/phosphodiesterase
VSDQLPDIEVQADETDLPRGVDARFERRIVMNVPDRHNPKLRKVMELVNADDDLYALWTAANVNAVERLSMTDHGPVHVKNYEMDDHDAEVVVALAALFHDLGMSIHRADHESYSLFIADAKLREILPQVYAPRLASIIRADIQHAIISHRSGGKPFTLEAGIVRIADALDMAKGRSRIPFEAGSLSIHSVSAAAVESVSIERGTAKAIAIVIEISNSAGLFQLDQLLLSKLQGSGLEKHLEIRVRVGTEEKRLLDEDFTL